MKKLYSLFLIFIFACQQSIFAYAPEEVTTPEIKTTQSINGEEAAAPYAITGESIVAMLQSTVGFEVPGSSIVFHRRTGQIFVRNTPKNHEIIAGILDDLRKTHRRQVHIEARIITVSGTDFEGVGVESSSWQFITSPDKNFAGGSGTIDDRTITTTPTRSNFSDLNTIFDTDGIGDTMQVGIQREGLLDIDLAIDALGRKVDLNMLAAPSITVFNNERANITIEKNQFYISRIDSSFSSEGSTDLIVAQDPDVDIARSGTILDVTPSIHDDGTITLELHPHYVRVDLSNTQDIENASGITSNSVTLPVYVSQEINTTVTVDNGGVIVLGGLISEKENNLYDKVPVLGDIPLIGKAFFQNNQAKNVKTHLLMFVKPTFQEFEELK
jgi:MSHA biogenesis protein MshL